MKIPYVVVKLAHATIYHVVMTYYRLVDPEFKRRFDKVRRLAREGSPLWQRERAIDELDRYFRSTHASQKAD